MNREELIKVAKTSLSTKLNPKMANQLVEIVVDAVNSIQREKQSIDLHMV